MPAIVFNSLSIPVGYNRFSINCCQHPRRILSSIEWTEETWNPVTGCKKIGPGCKFCYAIVMSRRLKAMGVDKYKDGFKITLRPTALNIPFTWKKEKVVFVNSMSDLFHNERLTDFIKSVSIVMNTTPRHTYQVLTKRSDRLIAIAD